jgi:hypothetical protein
MAHVDAQARRLRMIPQRGAHALMLTEPKLRGLHSHDAVHKHSCKHQLRLRRHSYKRLHCLPPETTTPIDHGTLGLF